VGGEAGRTSRVGVSARPPKHAKRGTPKGPDFDVLVGVVTNAFQVGIRQLLERRRERDKALSEGRRDHPKREAHASRLLWEVHRYKVEAKPRNVRGRPLLDGKEYDEKRTASERAVYVSEFIKRQNLPGLQKILPGESKLCSRGKTINFLFTVQRVPGMLIGPGSTLKRLICVLNAGAGKTNIMLDVLSNYIDHKYTFVMIGDPDIFLSIKGDLQKSPASYISPVDGEPHKLRTFKEGVTNPWCLVYSTVDPRLLPDGQNTANCAAQGAVKFGQIKIAWMTYVQLGNWLYAHPPPVGGGGKAKFTPQPMAKAKSSMKARKENSNSKYGDTPFSDKVVLCADEVQKMVNPSEEPAKGMWQSKPVEVGKILAKLGQDQRKNPTIVGFTATPIVDDVIQLICLATIFKGQDPAIFTDSHMTELRVDPYRFFAQYTTKVKSLKVHFPGPNEDDTKEYRVAELVRLLSVGRCTSARDPAKGGSKKEKETLLDVALKGHPCPVSAADKSSHMSQLVQLTDSPEKIANLEILLSDLFFITNSGADSRRYPALLNGALERRGIAPPLLSTMTKYRYVPLPGNEGAQQDARAKADYVASLSTSLRANLGLAWREVSNFSDVDFLKEYVDEAVVDPSYTLSDELRDRVELCAPKWKALADDLEHSCYGKTAVYTGTKGTPGTPGVYFLMGLLYYLKKRFPSLHNGVAEIFEKDEDAAEEEESGGRNWKKTQDALPAQTDEEKTQRAETPTLYVIADVPDSTEIKFLEKDIYDDTPRHRLLYIGEAQSRERQFNRFKAAACVHSLADTQRSSRSSLCILGFEAYKALDLRCVSNLMRLVLQPAGKGTQTIGRAHRSCSFSSVEDHTLWKVMVRTYCLSDPDCGTESAKWNCDCVLGSYYTAQEDLLEKPLNRVLRSVGVACSIFKEYSDWPGGVKCIYDSAVVSDRERDFVTPEAFFRCDRARQVPSRSGEDLVASPAIVRSVCGDVSPELVRHACGEKCPGGLAVHEGEGSPRGLDVQKLHAHIAVEQHKKDRKSSRPSGAFAGAVPPTPRTPSPIPEEEDKRASTRRASGPRSGRSPSPRSPPSSSGGDEPSSPRSSRSSLDSERPPPPAPREELHRAGRPSSPHAHRPGGVRAVTSKSPTIPGGQERPFGGPHAATQGDAAFLRSRPAKHRIMAKSPLQVAGRRHADIAERMFAPGVWDKVSRFRADHGEGKQE
jgi:hypothetical protein